MKTEHSRSQFTFYASYFNAVDRLPKSRRAEAFYAIVLYALDGIEPEGLSAGVDGVFEACRPNIDSGRSKAEIAKSAKGKTQNDPEAGGETKNENKDKIKDKGKVKDKIKTKIKAKSEEERKTETEIKTEGAPAGAANGRPQETNAMESTAGTGVLDGPQSEAAGAGLPALSLPERKENHTIFCGTTPVAGKAHAPLFSGDGPSGRPQGDNDGRQRSESRLTAAEGSSRSAGMSLPYGAFPEQREPYAEMFRADPILASAWRDLLAPGPGVRPLGNAEREPLLARLRAAPEWERLAILSDRLGSPLSRDWQTLRRRAGI